MATPDQRLGIVRLPLPNGREVALQVTYRDIDRHGPDWALERFKTIQKGKAGASTAMAELLELFSGGALTAEEIMSAPAAAYPMSPCLKSAWDAWSLAQYGPDGRSADDGDANPRKRPLMWWARLTGRR